MRYLCLAVLFAGLVWGQSPSKQPEVDKIFSASNTHTPGCAVGVAEKGSVVLRAGYGMADLERNVPITGGTIFESGSVAKQFTAAALILLAQQGKISLDDPMRKYLPELADYGAPLTIRQVLSHRSGLREWRPIAAFGGRREGTYVYTNQDLLQMAAQQRGLNFDPGTHYSYTNTGFNISTILIERALGNGKTFQEYTHDVIFGPLNMVHTKWRDNIRAVVPGRALAYGLNADKVLEQQTPIENIIGAGGLLTTVGDLLLWNENFTHAKVGGPDFVKFQQTPATLSSGRKITYAAGLTVSTVDGLRVVSHSGATGGYRTWLARYPDQGVSVAVLCNSAQANPARLGQETARLWTGASAKAVLSSYKLDPGTAQSMAGFYRKLRDNTVVELRSKDGKLLFGAAELVPTGPGTFENAAGQTTYRFSAGTPPKIEVAGPDDDVHYVRVDPVTPTAGDLAPLLGRYESRETGTTLVVETGKKPGELLLRIADEKPIPLRPTFRDGFAMASGASIFFVRDAGGKVVALSAGEDRVWDLRFTRVR